MSAWLLKFRIPYFKEASTTLAACLLFMALGKLFFIPSADIKLQKGEGNTESTILLLRIGGLFDGRLGALPSNVSSSILLAKALGAEVLLEDVTSAERSGLSKQFNGKAKVIVSGSRLCDTSSYLSKADIEMIAATLCEGKVVSEFLKLKLTHVRDECDIILHKENNEYQEERFWCVANFLQERLRTSTSSAKDGIIRVGVYMRQGDPGNPYTESNFNGIRLSVTDANEGLRWIGECSNSTLKVTVYIEDRDVNQVKYIHNDFSVFDSGDGQYDFNDMVANDVFIAGNSTFALVAAVVSDAHTILTTYESKPSLGGTTPLTKRLVYIDDLRQGRVHC